MVDKKLSEFSQITPEEIVKLICLYLDENNAIKNGVVDFSTLNNLIVHKDGAETIIGNKTFSGDSVFEGQATFNETVNANISGTAEKAKADASGNTITSTYATKTELSSLIKPGFLIPYGGSTAPTGYLICDGSAISRTAYSALFSVIGTTYGSGDGSTTFNIPNIGSIVKSVNESVPIKGSGGDVYVNSADGSVTGRLVRMFPSGNSIGYGGSAISSSQNLRFGTANGNPGLIGTVTRSIVNFRFIIKY